MTKIKGKHLTGAGKSLAPIKGMFPGAPRLDQRRNAIFVTQQEMDQDPLSEMVQCSDGLAIPSHVFNVLHKIEEKKNSRDKESVSKQLHDIHTRVSNALKLSGMEEFENDGEFAEDNYKPPAIFDAKQKREEASKQAEIMEGIDSYMESVSLRKSLLAEIGDWMEFSKGDMTEDICTDSEMDSRAREYTTMSREFGQAMKHAGSIVERIQDLSNILIKEIGTTQEEEEEPADLFGTIVMQKPKGKLPTASPPKSTDKSLMDDAQIINKTECFEGACSQVFQAIDQSIRHVRKNAQKNVLRTALKQFRFLIKAMEKRIMDLKQKEDDNMNLSMKNDLQSRTINKLKQDKSKQDVFMNALDAKVLKLEAEIKKLGDSKASLQQKLALCNKTIENLNQEIDRVHEERTQMVMDAREEGRREAERESQMLSPPGQGTKKTARFDTPEVPASTPVPPLPHEVVDVDALVDAATQPLQDKLTETETLLGDVMEDRNVLLEKLKTEEEKIGGLEAAVETMALEAEKLKKEIKKKDDAEKKKKSLPKREESLYKIQSVKEENESLERQVTRLMNELKCKDELVEYQESRIGAMREELGSLDFEVKEGKKEGETTKVKAKKLAHRLQKVHDTEINRFKNHLEKERARNEAVIRRIERHHKDHLSSVQRQSLHLLRAINRFKETVAQMFERENLPLAAHDVRRVPNLPTEDCPEDAKLLLAQMAGGAVELLVTVEFKISQVLMNKRLELKNKQIALNFSNKDLQVQRESAQKAKVAAENLTYRLQEMTVKLAHAGDSIRQLKGLEVQLAASSEKYRQLMQQYTNLQRGMGRLQQGFEDNLRSKEKELILSRVEKGKMERYLNEQRTLISRIQQNVTQRESERKTRGEMTLVEAHTNLGHLKAALKEDKISDQMYKTCTELLTQRVQWPLLRLRHIIHNYKKFRDLLAARDGLEEELKEKLTDREPERITILSRIDASLSMRIRDWREIRDRFQQKKIHTIKRINIALHDYLMDVGVVPPPTPTLTQPPATPKGIENLTTTDEGYSGDTSLKSSSLTQRTSGDRLRLPRMPSKLTGLKMSITNSSEQKWHLPDIDKVPPQLTTPCLLHLDMNQHMRLAGRSLRQAHRRLIYPIRSAQACEYSGVKVHDLGETVGEEQGDNGYSC